MTKNEAEIPEKEGAPRITVQIDQLVKETKHCKRQVEKIHATLNSPDVSSDEKEALSKKLEVLKNELTIKDDLALFMNAVRLVTLDKGFDIGSEIAQKARLTAERLVFFSESNEVDVNDFARWLLKQVRSCCTHPRAVSCHTFKERMWEKFYKLCSGKEFRAKWMGFIQNTIGFKGNPIFFQFVTRSILEDIIKTQLPTELTKQTKVTTSLDFEEYNALRYCGGYLIRSLKKKIKKSARPLKDSLLLCLNDLIEDDDDADDSDDSEKWLLAINRGSLIRIDDKMFQFLVSVEVELRKHLYYITIYHLYYKTVNVPILKNKTD